MRPDPGLDLLLPPEERTGTPLWYITFSDLMALLVGFFVLLFGFSTMETHRFKALAGSMREAFGSGGAPEGAEAVATEASGMGRFAVFERAQQALAGLGLADQVEASLEKDGVRLRVGSGFLFAQGSAALDPGARKLLAGVADLAQRSGGTVVVEGHTDDVPVRGGAFPSNWELAGARAGAVVRYLSEQRVPGNRLAAQAFADTRPRASNKTDDGRQRNRRVEILIRTDSGADRPPE